MKNLVQIGIIILWTNGTGSDVSSGDHLKIGSLSAVATVDIANGASGNVQIQQVFDLSVEAVNDAGNSAVAVGDKIYIDTSGDLSKKSSGTFYGIATEILATGTTGVINVLLPVAPSVDGTGLVGTQIVASGEVTTAGGAAAEEVALVGVLATDTCIVVVQVVGAAPKIIITSICAADKITVTFDGDPSTDHVISYLVLRAA